MRNSESIKGERGLLEAGAKDSPGREADLMTCYFTATMPSMVTVP